MEFKKPKKYSDEQLRRNSSRVTDSMLVKPRPVRPSVSINHGDAPKPISTDPSVPHHAAKTINININLGSLLSKVITLLRERVARLSKKAIVGIVLVLIVVGALLIGSLINQHNAAKNAQNKSSSNEIVENLEYQTILPSGKSITDLGGWRRVSPSKNEPVFAFTDKIGKTSISVSQQPIPPSFLGSTDEQVAELAKKFNATNKINAGEVVVYVGTSAKGPQSAIFTKNSLLIMIKSQEKVSDAAWIKYIMSLN